MTAALRSPICTVMGHVDHGKTSILDKIRGTAVAKGEAGGITQAISSTTLSLDTIKRICGKLLDALKLKFTIPGLLFIDSPGHAAFTNLRKRGGSLADIAIVVVDLTEGLKPQTLECLEILRHYKTPFVVAANKVDLLQGWQSKGKFLVQAIQEQPASVQAALDRKIYELVGQLYEHGFQAERFDRIENYQKQITIVPSSAKTGDGIPELLMVISGLAQRFLEDSLKYNTAHPAKGIVLEVKETKGMGTTLDVIIYDGALRQGDQIAIGGLETPVVTKVKALFESTKQMKSVKEVVAAASVKVSAPDLHEVIAGMPLCGIGKNAEAAKKEVQQQVEEVLIDTDHEGIVVKADSLGSLEAVVGLLKEKGIAIKKASIGDISKNDQALAAAEDDPLNRVVLGFNVKAPGKRDGQVITHEVIYQIIDDLENWREAQKKALEAKELQDLWKPAKVKILLHHVFRQNNPAVVGVAVLGGTLMVGVPLMKENGDKASEVKSMQLDGETIGEAEKGKEIAIALPHLTVGRQICEEDLLYSDLPEDQFVKLKKLKKHLSSDQVGVLKEIAEIKRKHTPLWGV